MGWFNFTFKKNVSNGVRQGDILSPRIFALNMNGLTDELSNSYDGCYINDKCINQIMYADDICLMAPTGTAMQNLLDVCHNYGSENDILFNPLKSVCIVYKPKYYKLRCPSVNIGSERLQFVNETNYLGFTFCSMNKDDKYILRQMRSVYANSNRILRMFSHCSIDVKIVLFNSYALPCNVPICGQNTRKRLLVKFE